MIRLERGHNSEQYGRPDERVKEFFVYDDSSLIGVVRLTPPRHIHKWYWQQISLWNKHGVPWRGPVDTREEAVAEIVGAMS